MRFFRKSRPDEVFVPPKIQAHRSFAYLDDDTVINSLSALESGKVDEVVEKINLAQASGTSVGLKGGAGGLSLETGGENSSSQALQAEVIRRRTRFSIFELWYSSLTERNAIGRFNSWNESALAGVNPGQVIEVKGTVNPVALHTGIRMFLWFVDEVRNGNPLFAESSTLEGLEGPEFTMKFLRGKRNETPAIVTPVGDPGPSVAASFLEEWVMQPVGRWNGIFTIIAQVEEVLQHDETWQAVRIIEDAPLTSLEEDTIQSSLNPMKESMSELGIELGDSPSTISGPLLVLRPIAMFR